MKNATLVETTEKRQDQLNKQANIIGDIRTNMNKLEIQTKEKDVEIKRITDMNNELVMKLVSRDDTINDLEERLIQFVNEKIPIEPSRNQNAPNRGEGANYEEDHLMNNSEQEMNTISSNKTSGYNREGLQMGARPKESQIKSGPPTVNRFNCTECSETRTSEETLTSHIRCHEDPGENTCDNCTYQNNDRSQLRNHLKKTRHTGTLREFLCNECRLEFKSEEEEKSHMNNRRC